MTTGDEVLFREPHPLGLPADRYSHPIRTLGSGTFGKVYLCCLRPPPQLAPHPCCGVRDLSIDSPASLDSACILSPDADLAAPTEPSFGTQPNQRPDPAAHHPYQQLPEWVAVKISKPLVQCDLRSLEYLKREVVNQCRLQHPHVIGFREVGITTDMRSYLALEYADSGTLKHWLADRGGRLPEASARWFAQQLVYGLAYCHAHGVYNRDIKPDNLLLHSNWQEPSHQPLQDPLLKVADFGLCKSSSDSVPNSCVGSPHYMAPEVFTGKEYDGCKADVFSCGVVLYQMVFGVLPFNRTLDGRKLDFHRNFKDILENMRRELWPQLLPPNQLPSESRAHAAAGEVCPPAPAVPPAAAAGCPSPGLMDLLHGMLRFDPAQRLSLYDVKRHAWYREGLTEECYAVLLSGDGEGPRDGADGGGAGRARAGQAAAAGGAPSEELIEAEFNRIIAHCAALQRQAAQAEHLEEDLVGT